LDRWLGAACFAEQMSKIRRVCGTCTFSSFTIIDGNLVCKNCHVVQDNFIEEGQESGEDHKVMNFSRVQKLRGVGPAKVRKEDEM
jgi:hypothetical protein